MRKYFLLSFCLFALLSKTAVFAQTSEKYNSVYAGYYRGEELFEKEQYSAARYEFRTFIDNFAQKNDPFYIKARYYEGLSALEVFNNDALDLLQLFIKEYPESVFKYKIYLRLGHFYYQKKDFEDALAWYNQLPASEVEPEDLSEYYFKIGYSNFQLKKMSNAKSAFFEIKDGSSNYSAPALYYYSHIAYDEGSYQTALEGFQKLENDERFSKIVPYYIAQIYYLQGNYQAVTDYAAKFGDSTKIANEADLNHIIGDAYYRTKRYDEAADYLAEYSKTSKTTRDDEYELGYSLYRSKQFEKAIRAFDKVARVKDALGQVALYHIGECYLKLNNPTSARSAFQTASTLSYNPVVEEDALYNFAILSYKLDLNPYNEALVAFETYLDRYPNSKRKNDVYQYLINVYTQTNNYEKALSALDALPNKDSKLKAAYQIIAYNYGIEQYQKANYDKAIKILPLVETYPIDAEISAKAKFWMADAYYRKANYPSAISVYKEFISKPRSSVDDLKSRAYYNIGYAYLEQDELSSSSDNFEIYVNLQPKPNNIYLFDAYMRLGDNAYVQKNNDKAITYYKQAIAVKGNAQDQALYYLSRSLGFAGKSDERVKILSDILNNYPKSKYVLNAIEQLGGIYKQRGDYDKSMSYYNMIINDYPNSELVKNAELSIAELYFYKKQYDIAEKKYIAVLEKYAANDRGLCEIAARNLFELYKVTQQPQKTDAVIAKYPCANVSQEEQQSIYYNPAKKAYDDKDLQKAISLFETYLNKFPTGVFALEAKNYLANSLYDLKRTEEAIVLYKETLNAANNGFTETAAIRVSKYLYNNGSYEEAIPYYERLVEVTSNPEVSWNSEVGLMRSFYLTEIYTNASVYATNVLSNSLTKTELKLEANYIKGMSNFNTKTYSAAVPSLEYVTKNTTTAIGAESKFTLAQIYFDENDLVKSDKELRALLKMKPTYDYWIAKALMLQSKISVRNNDLFQAEQTLKSVIDHYPITDDGILDEARQLYDELLQLKNQPKDNTNGPKNIIEINEGN